MPFPALAAIAASPVVASLVGSAVNAVSTGLTNRSNISAQKSINQQNLDYASAMTQAQWERDDSAHQREVKDLVAAGLSPLAATNGSAVTPAQTYAGEAYQAQAPQMDVNSLVQSMLGFQQLEENKRQHDDKMNKEDKRLTLQAEEVMNTARSLDLKDKELNIQKDQVANAYSLGCKQLEQAALELKTNKSLKEREMILNSAAKNSEMINNTLRDNLGKGFHSYPVYDLDQAVKALEAWGAGFDAWLKLNINPKGSQSKQQGKSTGAGFSLSGAFGINGQHSENGAISESVNQTYDKALILQYTAKHPMPFYAKSF